MRTHFDVNRREMIAAAEVYVTWSLVEAKGLTMRLDLAVGHDSRFETLDAAARRGARRRVMGIRDLHEVHSGVEGEAFVSLNSALRLCESVVAGTPMT
jgi:hypothetical protein